MYCWSMELCSIILFPELDQAQKASDQLVGHRYGDRRCISIGNLRPTEAEDVNNEEVRTALLSRTRSASQPRTSRRQLGLPPPPPTYQNPTYAPACPPAYAPAYAHGNQDQAFSRDADDPDLYFDDPRRRNHSRECTPVRDMVNRMQRHPVLYGEQTSRSVSNLEHPGRYGSNSSTRHHPLHGTKSASQSRTSLRSMKRKAPQPPVGVHRSGDNGGYPAQAQGATNRPEKAVRDMRRSASGTPMKGGRNKSKESPSGLFKRASDDKNNNRKPVRPKYYNPYAPKPPVLKPKPRLFDTSDKVDSNSSVPIFSDEAPQNDHRRYSDTRSLDESEHGMGESDPVGILGDFDMDAMEDDGQW